MLEIIVVLACVAGIVWVSVLVTREAVGARGVRTISRLVEDGRFAEARLAELPAGKDKALGLCLQAKAAAEDGDIDGGLELFDAALALPESRQGVHEVVSLMKANLLRFAGRYDEAIAAAYPFASSEWAVDLRARIAVDRGEDDLAEALLSRERQLYPDDAARLRTLALHRLNRGAYPEADGLLGQALAHYERLKEPPHGSLAQALLLRAETALEAGASDVARGHLRRAVTETDQLPTHDHATRMLLDATAAAVAARAGDTGPAQKLLSRAEELATRVSSPPLQARLTQARAEVALADGRRDEALVLMGRAIELHDQLGERGLADRLRSRLARLEASS